MRTWLIFYFLPFSFASLVISYPPELKEAFTNRYNQGVIPSSIGNFGNPPYGSTLTGFLIAEDTNNVKGCSPLPLLNTNESVDVPIVMLERGDCAFVLKVRNAQNIGAKAVIIVNDNDEDPSNFIMTDNGQGGNLDIPAFLISKDDGKLLRDYYLKQNNGILMIITFEIAKSAFGLKIDY